MVNGILNFNLLKNGLEESASSLSRYYDGKGDAPTLNKNLFVNLNVPIPALNYIIDESKNYLAGNASYQRCSQETFRHSKNLLDIIMRISLQRRARTDERQRAGEKAHPPEGAKQAEQPKGEELPGGGAQTGEAAHSGEAAQPASPKSETQRRGGPPIAHAHHVEGQAEGERLKYYPGFCKQLGAKGRRCMLELIRRVYREKTSTCKNILAHKLKPPECISNLPFFNINMLWKLSYEFGVFEEALKIHRIYGQSAGAFSQLLNGGCSAPSSSTVGGATGGANVKREVSEEQRGGGGPSESGEPLNGGSGRGEPLNCSGSNGERGRAGRKRKRQECPQVEGKYNWSRESLQSREGVPQKRGAKKAGQISWGGEVPDGRRPPIDSAKWSSWGGQERGETQCATPQLGCVSPAEGRSARGGEAHGRDAHGRGEQGSAPPRGTTERPPNCHTLRSGGITMGANPRGEEKSSITGNGHMEGALPNLSFNENCESCRMNKAHSRGGLLKGGHDEEEEEADDDEEASEEEEADEGEEAEPSETKNHLKAHSVEELLSSFLHISNAILLHLKKNKGTCLPKARHNLLSDHCLLLIPIKQEKGRKRGKSNNAKEGKKPNAQRRVHQQDDQGGEQMKNDRVLHEVGMSLHERGNSIAHRLAKRTSEGGAPTELGSFSTPNGFVKESFPPGQRKTAKWRRKQGCSPAWAKGRKLTSGMANRMANQMANQTANQMTNQMANGMTDVITPVVVPAKNEPFERCGGDYRKIPPLVEIPQRITSLQMDSGTSANWGSFTNRGSHTGRTAHEGKNPSGAHRGRGENGTTARLASPLNRL
ncbi:conserved Plasmodium protein, unknown function [Plasmodium vivax]|uniref:Uncharacterized protein n=3 Tax=Plasmodium vivax TaxID=5855 RepID=A0A0J9TQW7_PLAVI|nr:hypothetical protein PVBG_02229 [Plasmodium vivax Brazil I]KMZ98225.1 hypothetical protein PVNG_06043 [Plasmodium vivax North Korean]CAG9473460.1 unnamed protein product [Plasmodium vivax]CAI7722095.1 conserved Plasmodium protein, unknown function [Plasmodium vivax]SCO74128.1 conserved Plasmodium protein, unknown function [Plasmodium vivax]